jgi:hypothetical protein
MRQIIHIVKQLSTMLADWRLDIRANCFCPGVYPSDMSKVGSISNTYIMNGCSNMNLV